VITGGLDRVPGQNRYILTPSHAHIAVKDPVWKNADTGDDAHPLSLETACGRSLVDGQTWDLKRRQRLQTLEDYPNIYRCRACFTRAGEDPAPGSFAPPSRHKRRRRPR
jgi:hypothetical protein